MKLTARLSKLERKSKERSARPNSVRLFWDDELYPCKEHSHCDIARETGEHHVGVLHLDWAEDRRE
jgi:hypothetical protein